MLRKLRSNKEVWLCKRARLKEKKNKPEADEKKEFKKVIKEVKIPETE